MKKPISPLLILAFVLFGGLNAEIRESRTGYSITYEAGLEKDAIYIEESIEYAIDEMDTAFHYWNPRERIENIELEVILHPKGKKLENIGATISPGFTMINNGYNNGVYGAKLHICSPSFITNELTSMRGPMDRTYHNNLMIHELFSVIADQVTKEKKEGWHIYSAPNWFIQGLEQYVALSITDSKEELNKYIDNVRENPDIIQTDFGLELLGGTHTYTGGTVLLNFICRDGDSIIKNILESTEPTFGKAMRTELDMEFCDFISEFEHWLDRK